MSDLVRLLLRIRPSATIHKGDLAIHPYVNTAEASKFGFGKDELDQVLTILEGQETTKVVGIHCKKVLINRRILSKVMTNLYLRSSRILYLRPRRVSLYRQNNDRHG